VSARHQVKRLDRIAKEFALSKTIRQKKQVFFVRCGSSDPQFHRAKARLKSGPDVFADALVPRNARFLGPSFPETPRFPERLLARAALHLASSLPISPSTFARRRPSGPPRMGSRPSRPEAFRFNLRLAGALVGGAATPAASGRTLAQWLLLCQAAG